MGNSGAPQVIILPGPPGSATASPRPGSAYRLSRGPSAVNRHGWVLCTDGAQTALATTCRTISSSVICSLMYPAHACPPGARSCQGPWSGGTLGPLSAAVYARPAQKDPRPATTPAREPATRSL